MPFYPNLSAAWNCSAVNRSRGEENASCISSLCYNGHCTVDWYETEGLRLPFGSCSCDPGWTGNRCDECCDIPCENNGTCGIDAMTALPFCKCHINYTGFFCEKEKNFTDDTLYLTRTINNTDWEIPLVVSLILIVLTAVSMFLTLCAMYRRRHPWLVKVMVKYHSRFMDDTDRTYDAYLSYRTNNDRDRKFVVLRLLPYLEQEGYSVCIDQRDFIPGAAIANSIAEAIAESRRTILLLSPAYVEGEWPEFEVQCALKESLKKNHRIIPIIFEPLDSVKEDISPTLRHITDFITCLEWPMESQRQEENDKTHAEVKESNGYAHRKEKECNGYAHGKEKECNGHVVANGNCKQDKNDEMSEKEKKFWKRLVLTLPKRVQKEDSVCTDQEKGLKSFQSQISVPSITSESHELLDIPRANKPNLFDRRHFDNVFAIQKAKIVQVVHPQPRPCPKEDEEEYETEDIKCNTNDIEYETEDIKLETDDIKQKEKIRYEIENGDYNLCRSDRKGSDSGEAVMEMAC